MHFATWLLVSAILGTAPPPQVDGCASLEVELDLQLDAQRSQGADLTRAVLSSLPLYDRVYSTGGWVGVAIDDQLAVLVDIRLGGQPTSPDPARPNPRASVEASLGIALRSWDSFEL